MVDERPHIKSVEVRTWPERTDVMVIAEREAQLIGHYLLDLDGTNASDPLFNPCAPFAERSAAAVEALERDQEYLGLIFDLEGPVCLEVSPAARAMQQKLLAGYGLELDELALARASEFAAKLEAMPLEQLFELLVEWHDVVERHYPAGSSRRDPDSWVHRAGPDGCHLFHYLASGSDRAAEVATPEAEDAYEAFQGLSNPTLAEFSFGTILRWVYYHRAEFPGRERFQLRALSELGINLRS